ncbi:MAG: fibronectin type III domain-containing protein [Caldilineaceae bacterium SB0665_bin_25]|nr:fibronectin type III domain-containing protein [Caldilineaceae bacterium SB0665_bin_25]
MREVSRVQMVFRVFIHVILRMCVTMLRLLINKFSLAIVGALIVVGAIVAAMSMAPPQKSVEGQVEQHSMEELTVQFATAPLPLSLPLLHVSSYDIQWTSVGTGESWTTQGEITISGVTEGTDAVSYTVKGLDPERVYRFRTRGRNLLGAGPWSDWFPSNGLVPGPGPTPTPEPTATPTPTPTPQTETNTVYFDTDQRPTVGREITARVTLSEDAYSNLGDWQWQRSETALSDWVDITSIDIDDTDSYTPVSTDVGSFLRVYVTYTDSEGILKRGLSPTIGPVQE